MDNIVVWIIIIAFYAPLHFMLPVLILFITGKENESTRKALIRQALLDSGLSMLVAFALAIILVQSGYMNWAMLALLVSMPMPFIRIAVHRKQITGDNK
jgi:hypothetical protein